MKKINRTYKDITSARKKVTSNQNKSMQEIPVKYNKRNIHKLHKQKLPKKYDLLEAGYSEVESVALSSSIFKINQLHFKKFGVFPVEIGALGIHSLSDYKIAVVEAIYSNKKYDELQDYVDSGMTKAEARNLIF